MRILILGGTAFLSAATARLAVARGHRVSCLARGTHRRPPDGADWVRADRDDGDAAYSAVAGRDWDAVIDVAMQPVHVRQALSALAGRTGHWTLVSTISVYADDRTPDQGEDAPLHPALPADTFSDPADYGPAKVACEEAVRAASVRAHICRAGLIAGPGDGSDRFGYWPARFARDEADDVLVPDVPELITQVIDVDDLAGWLLDAAEGGITGTFNATGESTPFPEVLAAAQQAAGHRGRQVAVPEEFLITEGVQYWAGPASLPLWVPAEDAGFGRRSIAAARAAGMALRPLTETIERTLADERERGVLRDRRAGLSPQTEERLLAAWRARSRGS